MTRVFRHTQTSFTGGEIDPTLLGRIDMSRYQSGVSRGRNVRVRLQGGMRRRGGWRHRLSLDDGTDAVRTAAFAFNTTQVYTIVLTAGKFRVLNRNGALVSESTGAPWTAAQVPLLNWTQSADTMVILNPDIETQRLRRGVSESSWTLGALPWQNIPSFDYGLITPTGTVTPSAASGKGITLTFSAAIATADMVGWQFHGNGGRVRITGFTDSTHLVGDVLASFRTGSAATSPNQEFFGRGDRPAQAEAQFRSLSAISEWSLEEPVISATRGWPAAGDFHLGRFWIGGFKSRPSSLMASVVGEPFNFNQGTALDDEGIYATIDGRQINAIHQIVSGRTLQIFTAGAEFAEVSGNIITPRTIDLKSQSTYGTDPGVRTTDVEGATLFAQARGAALRQFVYGDIEQAWASDLISFLSSHLIAAPVQLEMMIGGTGTDGSNVLITNADGTITLLTIARDQEIVAFTNWDTQGQFKSTSCLRSGEVFAAVLRDGAVRIEEYDEDALLDASVLVESATPFDDVAGLFHLAGLEVGMILDGAWLGTATVTAGGNLALPRMCTRAEIGLTFTPQIWPMPLEPRDPTGSLIGRKCRVVEIGLRVNGTGSFTVNDRPQSFLAPGAGEDSPLDQPPPTVTEDVKVRGLAGWKERHVVKIEQPVPGPLELLAISYKIQVGAL